MAVCSKYSNQVTLEASKVYFGKENLVCIKPTTSLLGGESFIIPDLDTSYQVWFTVGGAGTEPTPASGETLVPVALPASYTLAQFASLTIAALEGFFYNYNPKEDNSELLFEPFDVGTPLAVAADVDTGFDINTVTTGFEIDLGETSEGITVTIESSKLDVTADQTGPLVLSQLLQSTSSNLSMGLQQLSVDRLRSLVADGFGDKITPAGGTELIGYGTSKVGTNSLELAGRLRLHPLRLAESDRSEDLNYWKTVPEVTETNYSGTDKRVLTTNFVALRDEFKPEEINVMAWGDGSQNLLA